MDQQQGDIEVTWRNYLYLEASGDDHLPHRGGVLGCHLYIYIYLYISLEKNQCFFYGKGFTVVRRGIVVSWFTSLTPLLQVAQMQPEKLPKGKISSHRSTTGDQFLYLYSSNYSVRKHVMMKLVEKFIDTHSTSSDAAENDEHMQTVLSMAVHLLASQILSSELTR